MIRRMFTHLHEAHTLIRHAISSRCRAAARLPIHRLFPAACAVIAVLIESAGPTARAAGTDVPEQTAPSVDCETNCMRVNDIRLTAHNAVDGVRVGALVHVVDENGRPVPLVVVTVIWTKPNGSGHLFITSTDGPGIAPFGIGGNPGTYSLTVESLVRERHTFDSDDSVREVSITF